MRSAAYAQGRVLHSRFRPHPLARSPHLQTILPALLRPIPAVLLRIERLELPDGDFVDLGWAGGDAGPTAVLVHGLGGGFDSKYLLGLTRRLVASHWRVCALQLRGAGPEPNRLARAYHQGDTADLRHLWRVLRQREPQRFLASVGWSLGGNITLKALGEEGAMAAPDFACALSVPFDLLACAEHLRRGFARSYQKRLLDSLKDMVRRKHARLAVSAPANLERALAARDFFEYDDAFTAPLNGFADARDYYQRAVCTPWLSQIRVPTQILQALDDPFMPPGLVPEVTALSPSTTLELSAHGGHVGFVAADRIGRPFCWSEQRLSELLNSAYASSPQQTSAGHSAESDDAGAH